MRPGGVVAIAPRQDIWESRRCRVVVEHLQSESLWQPIQISDAEPYLPDHEDFADPIGVHYVAATIV